MGIDDDLVACINAEHLIKTRLVPADLLFVFGTRDGVRKFVDEAAGLWKRGYYTTAIVSGGQTPRGEESEAAVLKREMIAAGIPGGIIMTEDRATNTGENVIFSLPIIDSLIGLKNVRSVIALGKLCTSRRYPMTLYRHWPEVEKMLVAVNWFGIPEREWHLHRHSRERIVSEYEKVGPYLAKGFIAPWP